MAPHNIRVCALLCTCLLLMTDTFGVTGGTAMSNLAVKSNGTATRNGTATNLTTNSVVNGSMVVRITEENSTNYFEASTQKFKPNWSIYGEKINLKISIKTPNHIKCWEKCESKKKCKFITWIKKKKKCILFSSYKGGKEKKNCISGPFPTSSSAPPSPAPFNGTGIGNIPTNANESMILTPRIVHCLTSHGFPNNYPNSYYKRYDFSVTGQAMEITFHDFDVENENTCSYDRLWLYNGYSGASLTSPHGLCGNSLPPKFTIPTSSAILIFETDGSVTKRGFRLCYKAVDRCVTSPGYPNNYDNNEDHKHSFSLATSEPMEITFHSFDVEAHATCSYDRLEFYDGNRNLVKSLCGSSLPPKFTIPTSSADIIFITDESVTKKGFKFCIKETVHDSPCGKENPGSRISGGSVTRAHQYPWMVHLPMWCGGSLITDRHVLTAKHCVDEGEWRGEKVKVAVHDQTDPNDYLEVVIKDYVWPDGDYHDIAIIILETRVDLNHINIGTVCLPSSENEDYRGKTAMAMGWGMTHQSGQSRVLKHVKLTVSQNQQKKWLYTEVQVVNGVPQDPCAGDSGGPLVHQDVSTGRWTIIGTVFGDGYDCRSDATNGKGRWNKVTDHLDWIYKISGS